MREGEDQLLPVRGPHPLRSTTCESYGPLVVVMAGLLVFSSVSKVRRAWPERRLPYDRAV